MLQLAKGQVIALALVLEPRHVLPSPLSPSYCLHFIRHYVTTHGLLDITDKGDQVMFGGGGLLEVPVSPAQAAEDQLPDVGQPVLPGAGGLLHCGGDCLPASPGEARCLS